MTQSGLLHVYQCRECRRKETIFFSVPFFFSLGGVVKQNNNECVLRQRGSPSTLRAAVLAQGNIIRYGAV